MGMQASAPAELRGAMGRPSYLSRCAAGGPIDNNLCRIVVDAGCTGLRQFTCRPSAHPHGLAQSRHSAHVTECRGLVGIISRVRRLAVERAQVTTSARPASSPTMTCTSCQRRSTSAPMADTAPRVFARLSVLGRVPSGCRGGRVPSRYYLFSNHVPTRNGRSPAQSEQASRSVMLLDR